MSFLPLLGKYFRQIIFSVCMILLSNLCLTSCENEVIQTVKEDTEAPKEVSELSYSASESTILLSWKNPYDADFYGVDIKLFKLSSEETAVFAITLAGDSDSRQAYAVSNLESGIQYKVFVRTLDRKMNLSSGVNLTATTSEKVIEQEPLIEEPEHSPDEEDTDTDVSVDNQPVVIENAAVPVITNQPTNVLYTEGSPIPTISVTAISPDGGKLTYQWYMVNSAKQIYLIPNETLSKYTPTSLDTGIYYFVVITNTVENATNNKTAAVTSGLVCLISASLTNAQSPVITEQPNNMNYYVGDTLKPLQINATSPDEGTLSYQWYECTPENEQDLLIDGATTPIFKPQLDMSILDSYSYYCIVTNYKEEATTIKISATKSDIVSITINLREPTISGPYFDEDNGGLRIEASDEYGGNFTYISVADVFIDYYYAPLPPDFIPDETMLNETFYSENSGIRYRYNYVDGRYFVAVEGEYISVYGLPSQLQNSNYYKPVTDENREYIRKVICSHLPEGSILGLYMTKRHGFEIVYSLEYMGKNYEFDYFKWDTDLMP